MKYLKYVLIFIIIINSNLISDDFYILKVNDAITPASSFYIKNGIDEATEANAKAVIMQLNTPGGLLDATRDIVNHIFDSDIPVIVYVAPSGGRAGSAGVFITMAGHISAMAPGTNIGAAHPVGLDGSSDTTVLGQKIENDAAAFIRSISQKRNKNADWAERAVRNSESITEDEALSMNVVDFISINIDNLINQINGKTVKLKSGKEVTFNTKNYNLIYREKNIKEELLTMLSNPNLVYILILIGIWGIIYEFKSPGAIYPGAIGAFSLLVAGYSLQMLPVNFLGIALIFLAVILFILEIFVQSYALLTIGGVLSFAIGSLILIDSPGDFMKISLSLIIFSTVMTGAFFGIIIWLGIKAQNRKRANIASDMLEMKGYAINNFKIGEKGKVHLNGEIWDAISNQDIDKGNEVIVEKIEGFKLIVKK